MKTDKSFDPAEWEEGKEDHLVRSEDVGRVPGLTVRLSSTIEE